MDDIKTFEGLAALETVYPENIIEVLEEQVKDGIGIPHATVIDLIERIGPTDTQKQQMCDLAEKGKKELAKEKQVVKSYQILEHYLLTGKTSVGARLKWKARAKSRV